MKRPEEEFISLIVESIFECDAVDLQEKSKKAQELFHLLSAPQDLNRHELLGHNVFRMGYLECLQQLTNKCVEKIKDKKEKEKKNKFENELSKIKISRNDVSTSKKNYIKKRYSEVFSYVLPKIKNIPTDIDWQSNFLMVKDISGKEVPLGIEQIDDLLKTIGLYETISVIGKIHKCDDSWHEYIV